MANSIVIKALFADNNEIRRFSFVNTHITIKLLDKEIRKVFQITNDEQLIYKWKDLEGDYVRFTTQEELQEALKVCCASNSPCLHLSITSQWRHTWLGHVSCSICQTNPIRGERYICVECSGYPSLCSLCFQQQTVLMSGNFPVSHHNHAMLVIRKPQILRTKEMVSNIKQLMCTRRPFHDQSGASNSLPRQREEQCEDDASGPSSMTALGETLQQPPQPSSLDCFSGYKSLPAKLSRMCQIGNVHAGNITRHAQPPSQPIALTNPTEQEAMDKLMSMGYQDDNGLLKTLVREAKGDVNMVIDVLSQQTRP